MDGRRHRPRGATPPKTDMALVIEARDEAKNYLKQAENTLIKARDVHDSTLSSQRKIAFALSELIGKPAAQLGNCVAEDVLKAVVETDEQIRKRQESEVMNTIMNLAFTSYETIHISANYCPISHSFSVYTSRTDSDYKNTERENPFLLRESIYFGRPCAPESALDSLLKIEDQLIDLIVEAREEQENNESEVEA